MDQTRRQHKPSHEIQRLLGQANMAYIDGNHPQAIECYLDIIRRDPYVLTAWTSLGSCYDERGDSEAARQMRFYGAHLENEADTWKELANEYRWGCTCPRGLIWSSCEGCWVIISSVCTASGRRCSSTRTTWICSLISRGHIDSKGQAIK